jgi:hypothetical protein
VDLPVFLNDALSFEEHCEQVHTEHCVTAEQFPTSEWKGVMAGSEDVEDVEVKNLEVVQGVAFPEEK